MLECVANVSEGRDARVIEALATACRASLLDIHSDTDHHRSVFTLAGPGACDAERAARLLATSVARLMSLAGHEGVHPRMGALDVVPFVALDDATHPDGTLPVGPAVSGHDSREIEAAIEAAIEFSRWWSGTFEVPVFLYGEAHPESVTLPEVRHSAFRSRQPDFGPAEPHPALGATAVGSRPPLVAINCELTSPSVDTARRIASAVRERDGGLRGVRALGLLLASVGRAQVSMNLVDLGATGVEAALSTVRRLARGERTDVARVEVVGLVPSTELDRCSPEVLSWAGLDATCTIESRIATLPAHGGRSAFR